MVVVTNKLKVVVVVMVANGGGSDGDVGGGRGGQWWSNFVDEKVDEDDYQSEPTFPTTRRMRLSRRQLCGKIHLRRSRWKIIDIA